MKQNASKSPSAACTHHWDIEPPHGPVSKAQCRLCGAKTEFQNWQQWDEIETMQLKWRRGRKLKNEIKL